MAIRVVCPHCRHVNIIDSQPQQHLACVRCKSALAVCPQCGRLRPADAVICVQCGLDFRTGKKVVAPPHPHQFGELSLVPASPGEWQLTMRRRFLGIPLAAREFTVAGFEKVYYDTLDSWTAISSPTVPSDKPTFSLAGIGPLLGWGLNLFWAALWFLRGVFLGSRFPRYSWSDLDTSEEPDTEFFFEVGLLGPHKRFLRVKRSRDSAQIRAIAEWLSQSLDLPIERRDRRSPD